MCSFFSCIVTKSGDVLSLDNSDSHEEIIKHYKDSYDLRDNITKADKLKFARIEILPPNSDVFAPIKDWKFHIDQSITPSWFTNVDKENCFKALNLFIKKYFFVSKVITVLKEGRYWIKDSTIQELKGSVVVEELNASYVNVMRDNSKVKNMCNKSNIKCMNRNATVVNVAETSVIELMMGQSKVDTLWGNSRVEWMKDDSRIDWMMEDSTVKKMSDSAIIDIMKGNSRVNSMSCISIVNNMGDNSRVNRISGNAVAFKFDGGKRKMMCANLDNFIFEQHKPTRK